MKLSILGSVAFDTLKTNEGDRERIMGGSASYAAIAASKYSEAAIISVVGRDFPGMYMSKFHNIGINTDDIQQTNGLTFHWTGSYVDNINVAETVDTEIGVLGDFSPSLNSMNQNSRFLFLANSDPTAQLQALDQSQSGFIAMDTMNLWIDIKKEELKKVIRRVQMLFINDTELKMLTDEYNLINAAYVLLDENPGLNYLVLKKGEYGSAIFGREKGQYFSTSAYPLKLVKDPTGAGDSFAGSFLGYMTDKMFNWAELKEALLVGSVVSSFTCEEFGPDRLLHVSRAEIDDRLNQMKHFTSLG